MTNNSTGQGGDSSSSVKIQNFLEILRNSQSRNPNNTTTESRPGVNFLAEIQKKKEIENNRIEQFHHQRTQEWNKVFSSKEAQKDRRIEEIRESLKQLKKSLKRLDINLVKAVETPVINAGEYDESFLEHLKRTIHLYSLKVNSANSWLEVFNSRSKKQGAYWGMAKSKGTSYTQNNERNIATSVG